MFVLNRLRGIRGFVAKVIGLLLGILVYLLSSNYYVAIAVCAGYIIGESFGWGEWIGNLAVYKNNVRTKALEDGKSNGIQWLAKKIVPNYKYNYINYCRVALAIRGLYWWIPTLIPLYFIGISPLVLITSIIFLSLGFPLACEIGYRTSKIWNFKYMSGGWEHQEVWYGLLQDIVLFNLILGKMLI